MLNATSKLPSTMATPLGDFSEILGDRLEAVVRIAFLLDQAPVQISTNGPNDSRRLEVMATINKGSDSWTDFEEKMLTIASALTESPTVLSHLFERQPSVVLSRLAKIKLPIPPSSFVHVVIDRDMRAIAHRDCGHKLGADANNSPKESYLSILGDLVWAKYRHGEEALHSFPSLSIKGKIRNEPNPGEPRVDIKTFKTRISHCSRLMVAEDDVEKRAADYYVQVIVPENQPIGREIDAFLCGFTTSDRLLNASRVEHFRKTLFRRQRYYNYELESSALTPLSDFPVILAGRKHLRSL